MLSQLVRTAPDAQRSQLSSKYLAPRINSFPALSPYSPLPVISSGIETDYMNSEMRASINRENAKKSTGPRSPAGKAASSRNRLDHGLCAETNFLPSEDPTELVSLCHDLLSHFHPDGDSEEKLVMRIAAAQWRLHRAIPVETQIYREQIAIVAAVNPEMPEEQLAEMRGTAFMMDCGKTESFMKLSRYETALENSITRCLRQWKLYQDTRRQITERSQPNGGIDLPRAENEQLMLPVADSLINNAPAQES